MPSVTLHGPEGTPPPNSGQQPQAPPQSPSQRIVSEANAMRYTTDARGRTIGWRRLNALENFDLMAALGREQSGNETVAFLAEVACTAREIDGEMLSRPTRYSEIRAAIARLDNDGQIAVMQAMAEEAKAKLGAEGEPGISETDRAKNSAGTAG